MPRRPTTESDYRLRLLRAEQYLAAHLDEDVDPAALAEVACFSLHHFHRIFKAQLGESVMQHVRRLRLERAARLLRSGDARLLELALGAGYDSHEAFTRAFAAHFGVAPSVFREQPALRVAQRLRAGAPSPALPVSLVEYPPLRVALMRQRGSYAALGGLWQRMLSWVDARGLPRDALYGVCPDDPEVTPEARLRFDATVVVGEDFVPDGAVSVGTIAGGLYAVGVHRGPYDRLSDTYLEVIGRWFPSSGHEPAPDAVVEHYLSDPSVTPAAELLTEVRVRIA